MLSIAQLNITARHYEWHFSTFFEISRNANSVGRNEGSLILNFVSCLGDE